MSIPRFNMWGASHGQPGGPVEEADGEWVKWEDVAAVSAFLHKLADSMEKNGPFIDDYLRVRALAKRLNEK